jgi:L-2-hydroxyglutarate oxidase LhgO
VSSTDFLILGGGIIGLSIARELKHRFADAEITLLEKEAACGLHASGRNSGVIHAGFYYSANSLKAKLTRAGNQAMTAYCEAKKIPLNRCGKLVVALSGLAIALRSVRRYAILLFVHISIMMAMAMTFGGDSIRYLQPISFMTLLVLALGAKIALRSVRKDEAIAGWQRSSVETLRPDLNALVQSAFTGS